MLSWCQNEWMSSITNWFLWKFTSLCYNSPLPGGNRDLQTLPIVPSKPSFTTWQRSKEMRYCSTWIIFQSTRSWILTCCVYWRICRRRTMEQSQLPRKHSDHRKIDWAETLMIRFPAFLSWYLRRRRLNREYSRYNLLNFFCFAN